MKKKIMPLLILTLVVSLINTGLLAFIIANEYTDSLNFKKRIVISKDYDKGQSIEKAMGTGKPIIVWFYTDWCGYCQKFAPTFKKITKDKQIKQNFAIAYVNAENPENKKYTEEYNIEGFPTVYLVNGVKRELVSNLDLFAFNATESLKTKFLEFLN